jgi:hypothetical protein
MSKRQDNRQSRSGSSGMVLKSFLMGMTGPGAYFVKKPRTRVVCSPASVSDAWQRAGGYITRATESERTNVQKAPSPRKQREVVG